MIILYRVENYIRYFQICTPLTALWVLVGHIFYLTPSVLRSVIIPAVLPEPSTLLLLRQVLAVVPITRPYHHRGSDGVVAKHTTW